MTETNVTYGVLIERTYRADAEYVIARVMKREGNNAHPLNATDRWGYSDEPMFEGLSLDGYVSDYGDYDFHWHEAAYRDCYSANLHKVHRMLKMLAKINRQRTKDDAREHGDVFASFCKAVGAKWVVECTSKGFGTHYSDSEWRFMPVAEGKNEVRRLIREAKAQTVVSKS